MSIQIEALTKLYGSQRAIDQLSFRVEPGEIVGFLGPNGAGKSTTFKIATGYLPATSGTVRVNGHDVRTDAMAVRRSVGYLPEHNPLYLDQYVREQLRFAGSLHGLRGSTLTARVGQMIEQVGLTAEAHKRVGQLSKGYRQRVGLAQALLHNPPVLILDEPTTGLDPNQLADIRAVIREAGRDKTVLFSSHILPEVEALCDRVVIINRGQIVADGPVSVLRGSGTASVVVVAEFETSPGTADPQPRPTDVDLLATVPGVTQVEPLGAGRYRITADAGTDLRASIFRLAADRQLTLIGLKQEESSLDDIFRQLTR
jgi:ABC-2 type transport system ATP-binding protein